MAHQPQTNEEYIQKVLREAAQQQKEEVPTHLQIKQKQELQIQEYQQKLKFFSLVLVFIVLSYIVVKVIPSPFPSADPQLEN